MSSIGRAPGHGCSCTFIPVTGCLKRFRSIPSSPDNKGAVPAIVDRCPHKQHHPCTRAACP